MNKGDENMEFRFDVNPELDVAVGTEISFHEAEEEFEPEEYLGIDPMAPTKAKPGSEDKVRMLAARYAAGVSLWHHSDCYDHGPSDNPFTTNDGFDVEEDDF